MKKVMKVIIGILLVIGIGIGGIKLMQKIEHDQMVEIVKGEEVRGIIEKTLVNEDPQALTQNGLIKSYKIDYSTIRKNPMGGIMFNVIINDDAKLYGRFGLQKEFEEFRGTGMDLSSELATLLERK
ncbi:DUF1310 family protein [Streptococcus suis]|uniref:DUF1310 family protein n=2 Tax=Streptococcus suis TaxID=1307 RepID=G7SEY9_STRSU|nr:DUF1310 family protein [Streptococcus suis]AER18550.1 hypothetical protein SSUD12_0209 [Streptococcus suis D12]MCO8179297.1 DUF1310 domain-containing protein [Streptococcus suis]MCO8220407.1 DUF1310 domain-containing protein [Streptococcus suis]HEM3465716.1 DUF1310 family protein [Streptococcus suis]HEM3512255.1 DUF1310 family protein [Streptococcus suis]